MKLERHDREIYLLRRERRRETEAAIYFDADCFVTLFAGDEEIEILPAEARHLAAELVRLADEISAEQGQNPHSS